MEFRRVLCRCHSPSDLDIEIDDIRNKCESEEFQDWLTDVENNARLIKFWLSENKLDKFANKNIFIEHEGELYKADQLYYDFDSNCAEIDFLRCYIPHLCQETRDILESEQCWFEFKSAYFKKFEAAEMITSCVIPDENAMLLLGKLSNSVSFYQYIADKDVDLK